MASQLQGFCLWSFVLLILVNSAFISANERREAQSYGGRRFLLEIEDEEAEEKPVVKKKVSSANSAQIKKVTSDKNETKAITKPVASSASAKNQTKILKLYDSSKNKTKLLQAIDSNTAATKAKLLKPTDSETLLKTKLFKTTIDSETAPKAKIKKLINSTTSSTKKSSDLIADSPKNKTAKPITIKETKGQLENSVGQQKSNKTQTKKAQKKPSAVLEEDDDLVTEFRGLPAKFQETIVPDLQRISRTSKSYITRYNKEFAKGFKPYVGNKYASTIASFISFAFILIPFILVSLIFNRIKAHFSLQKILIFIQIYLAIYFSILCLSSLVTGLEPLRFFYTTSPSTYVCVQVLQTLSYVLYLLLLLMYLILIFSTETGLITRLLGLGQSFLGFAVGLHYYIAVFHRAILRQQPKTSWKVHALYATCFLMISLLGRFDREKKAYLDGDGEGKKS